MAFPFTALATLGGALIGARANSRAADKANALQDPVYVRERLEAAGLNPAIHYGAAASRPIATASPGAIIANGFSAAADIWQTDKRIELQKTQLEQENRRLNQQLRRATLNPKVPGIFGGQNAGSGVQDSSISDPDPGADGVFQLGKPAVTAAQDAGSNTYVDPRVADAGSVAERYGDILEEYAGIRVLWKDNAYNSALQKIASKYGRDVSDRVNRAYGAQIDKSWKQILSENLPKKPRQYRPLTAYPRSPAVRNNYPR